MSTLKSSYTQFRTVLGQNFHSEIMNFINHKDPNHSPSNISRFLKKNIDDKTYLTELSINGFSVLHDIVHFLSEKEQSAKFKNIWELVISYLTPEQKKSLAIKTNNQGFTLAQTAAYSGNP